MKRSNNHSLVYQDTNLVHTGLCLSYLSAWDDQNSQHPRANIAPLLDYAKLQWCNRKTAIREIIFPLDKYANLSIIINGDYEMTKTLVLWATKIDEPDYMESVITEQPEEKRDVLEVAKQWAIEQGYNRFRIVVYDDCNPEFPDFAKTINI